MTKSSLKEKKYKLNKTPLIKIYSVSNFLLLMEILPFVSTKKYSIHKSMTLLMKLKKANFLDKSLIIPPLLDLYRFLIKTLLKYSKTLTIESSMKYKNLKEYLFPLFSPKMASTLSFVIIKEKLLSIMFSQVKI
jgi:hypothetical protein